MRSRLLPLAILPTVAFLVFASTFSSAAVQNRIGSVRTSARAAIPNTIPHRALVANDLGAAPANRRLDSLTLTFSMTAAQQAALDQLLIDQQNPNSPRYHQWLTPAQFGAQFGLSSADLAQVTSWLTAQGFTITSTAASANSITFSGTVAQAQAAFGTAIHSLGVDGETHISNLNDPVLPAAIAAVVTHISGLNDFKPRARVRHRLVKPQAADSTGLHPDFTSAISGSHFVAPGDFYTIYNVKPLITSSVNGQGITIAVMGQTDILTTDVSAFRTASGLCTVVNSSTCPNPLPTVHLITGPDPGLQVNSGDLEEASLDVEWSGAVAPNANILYVNSGTIGGVFDSLIYAITANVAPIITISYGDCEANFGSASLASFNQYFQQANAQGQTIIGPSGDSGATDCDFDTNIAVGGLAVDFPGSSPFVTSAGGSMFNEGNATGLTSFWSANSSGATNNAGSANGYIPETVWNESSSANGLGAGGGGKSAFFTKPYWQLGTPADFSRDVPDIALNAASNHDSTLICTNGSCINGTYYGSTGFLTTVGGTSVATPTFAAIIALVEQKIGARIGNANPVIYALANSNYSATIFNDITAGNNNSPCQAGTPFCPTGGSIGFNAAVGYDLATGWGSVNAFNLANDWKLVAPISSGGGIGQSISTTTVTTANPICGVVNPTLSLTVRVASTGGNPTPTGTVQILIDGAVPTSGPVTGTLSGGSVTLPTVSTTGYASGSHTITAVYSGDTVNAGSKGYIVTDVVSSSKPDFSFTPCTATMTALPGASTPAQIFTVAPVNGFTGTVTLNATSTDSVNANFTFTPTSIVITSASSGTTSFVLQAFVANAVTGVGQFRLQKTATQAPPRAPWYAAGSGMALASLLLLVVPRRRRWTGLLAIMLSVAVLASVSGCTSSSNTSTGTGTTAATGTTNAAPGTYNVLVTAQATTTAGTVTHSSNVTFSVP